MNKEYETPYLLLITVADPDVLTISDEELDGWTKLY